MQRNLPCTLAALAIAACLLPCLPAAAEVPYALSYQGFLSDAGGNPVSGGWTMTFSLFHEEKGGDPFHSESLDLTTEAGLFAVTFGLEPGNAIDHTEFSGGEVFLEISIETDKGALVLSPRQRLVSNPFAFYSAAAADSEQLAGKPAADYVTVQGAGEVCITPGNLEKAIVALGFEPGAGYSDADVAAYLAANGFSPCACYGQADVAAYLLAAGYKPGPYFSGKYADLVGAPDLSGFVAEDDFALLLFQNGVLLSDGSVSMHGDLDFAGFQALNMRVHSAMQPPQDPKEGQLWWSTDEQVLRIYTGKTWALMDQGAAGDVACQGCIGPEDVAFSYAGSNKKSGAALSALDLDCVDCIDAAEVDFAWAKGNLPGGDALKALSADVAKDVNCPACIQIGEIDPAAMASQYVSYNDAATKLGAATVQTAIEKLASKGGAGNVNEGNGTVIPYAHIWGLPAYGTARAYMHLMNPSQPKVVTYLYGEESTGFSTSNNLVVAYSFKPNQYSRITTATAGQTAMQVENPSIFTQGAHALLMQHVGTGGNGTGAGNWELVQVVGIEGTSILLSKPLKNSYSSCGWNCGQAQAVVAASYNQLEIVNGGLVRPHNNMGDYSEHLMAGVLFIRARKIVVKTGGKIEANGAGFSGASGAWDYQGARGASECLAHSSTSNNKGTSPNCSGGGGANYQCCNNSTGGAGGGGNKTAGGNGGGGGAQGGTQKGDANLSTLHMGGGGGWALCTSGGRGGGLIVLGAETIIVENGGAITANGTEGSSDSGGACGGGGGGAGGTIALFTDNFINQGTVEALGGKGGDGPGSEDGGAGGDGWVVQTKPIPGVVNESFAKGVELWVDGVNITPQVGDPNQKGAPAWDAAAKKWGADGLHAWSTGPLDLTSLVSWTLGEHKFELKETGGAGGDLKMYTYVIYPFTESAAPKNDTCDSPIVLNLTGPITTSGTTEDIMGKTKATDANQAPFCGGAGGPDVVYSFTLADWRQLSISVQSAFTPRTYIKKGNCKTGEVVGCGTASWTSSVLEPGTYYFFVDSDGNLLKGNFILQITPAPPGPPENDSCAKPEKLTFVNGTAKASGMTLFSNDNHQSDCGGAGALENVYQFTIAQTPDKLKIALQAAYNPVMYIAKDTCTAAPFACIPSANGELNWPTPGTYYLFIDGKTAADKGLYTVTLTVN
jgi:hypothetical protein